MRDFHDPAPHRPQDQADGLRRLFAGRGGHLLALAANPFAAFGGVVLDRVAAVLAAAGHPVLVVDAAASSPPPHELARLDLAAAIERVAPGVSYLAARGLPLKYVDTRGSAGGFVDALQQAAPEAEVVLLHADALDLARLLKRRAVRPLLLGADHPESIKHAYASCKLLVQRCGLMSYDLLLAASPLSPRAAGIAASLGSCADSFMGAVLRDWALIDPAGDADDTPDEDLARLLGAQLELHEVPALPYGAAAGARSAPADLNPPRPVYR